MIRTVPEPSHRPLFGPGLGGGQLRGPVKLGCCKPHSFTTDSLGNGGVTTPAGRDADRRRARRSRGSTRRHDSNRIAAALNPPQVNTSTSSGVLSCARAARLGRGSGLGPEPLPTLPVCADDAHQFGDRLHAC